jgi:hypothetical protein
MLKSSSIFRRNGAYLVEKKTFEKKRTILFQSLNVLNMQKHFLFVSKFEHINFAVNEKNLEKNYDNPNYYVFLVIFQTYKNVVLRSVQSFEWLLGLCSFYPIPKCCSTFHLKSNILWRTTSSCMSFLIRM